MVVEIFPCLAGQDISMEGEFDFEENVGIHYFKKIILNKTLVYYITNCTIFSLIIGRWFLFNQHFILSSNSKFGKNIVLLKDSNLFFFINIPRSIKIQFIIYKVAGLAFESLILIEKLFPEKKYQYKTIGSETKL